MEYIINKLQKSDKMDTAPISTGHEETLVGDSEEEIFQDYRHAHADEGGFEWDLCAVDENGNEYFDQGNRDTSLYTEIEDRVN